jgi:hypothetical protein
MKTDVGLGVTTIDVIPTPTKAVPETPSLVAVIVAAPAFNAVTRPVLDTTATASLLELHPTTRSVSTVVPERTVATSWTFALTAMALTAGVTVTLVTGICLTLTVADPVRPSLVAKITAVPAAIPVTTPLVDTLATLGAPDVQLTTRPPSGSPRASRGVAVNVTLCPIVMSDWPGDTSTVATGTAVTVTSAVPVFPSLVAVIFAVPSESAVTTPVPETVATLGLSVENVIGRPVRTFP